VRAVTFVGAGGNEVVHLVERPDPVPGPDEVVVAQRYGGLNPANLAQRAGKSSPSSSGPQDIPGLDAAGTVVACGERVTSWRVGDRVFGIVGGGGLASRVVVHERCVARIPESLDDRDAAAVPEVFITAHDAIRSQENLSPGETLLVHGANGGVGTAAVQIGVALGAHVIGVVRSAQSADAVAELGAEMVIDERFAEQVLELTAGGGADVILELVGAVHFPENLRALATHGRISVVAGSGDLAQVPLVELMKKRASIRGSTLRSRPLERKILAIRAFEREVVPQLATGRLRALIDSVYPAKEVTSAFDRLEGRGKFGKILIDFDA
jgi:NADPH:quinone reductase